ncbi:MAG: hypothetical protein EOO65_05280 [Methanosarcinales archaeon]|nr:MAG: hypothetical protein EOO65_05280 [Methanosarcinales archaeon]
MAGVPSRCALCAEPSFRSFIDPQYNLRKCGCRMDWKEMGEDAPGKCRCGGKECPAYVNPEFLTLAKGQHICSLAEDTNYNCYATCEDTKSEPKWFASPCGENGAECDPRILKKSLTAAEQQAATEKAKKDKEEADALAKMPEFDPASFVDLRGLDCEMLNGKEQCYYEDAQGRELCPDYVTSEFLTRADSQYWCGPEGSKTHYCTVSCQEGNDEVRWGANERKWCAENKGSCPPVPQGMFAWLFTRR